MSRSDRRFSFMAIVLIAAGAVLGGFFGGNVQADAERPEDQLWAFGNILALIEDNYVGETNSKDMVEDAVAGMLRRLDPHSNYLSPDSFSEMRDEQRGRFFGLGIQITKRGPDKPLTIVSPIDDTPAFRAGLQSGDIISHIEGKPTLQMSVNKAISLLKGDKGTQVMITIRRPGTDEPFNVSIERDEIPLESIRVSYMIDERTGFVRVSNFTSTTADELDAAIEALRAEGMEQLMLDLRGNPGGLLDQAVQVSERFIDPNQMVVYTRGRIPGSNQDYVAKRGVERLNLPVVVLVDNSSASASEIVSGAIQDHDRGLVVGETTFGKGLVQRVIPLQNEGALAVTTAKYYTPSGRLIQRDYSDREEYYMNRGEDLERPDDVEVPREIFYTTGGRKVYGGGGVQPDYIVKAQPASTLLLRLVRENLIFDFSVNYNNEHPDLDVGFKLNAEELLDFKAFLTEREFEWDPAEFQERKDSIVTRIRSQISRIKWNQVEESRVLAERDPQIQRALEVFEEASALATEGAVSDPSVQAQGASEIKQPEIRIK